MPCSGILGYSFARSVASLAPTQNFRHILPALVLLRKPLFGLAKRRQPRTLGEIKTKSFLEFMQFSRFYEENKIVENKT
jgi:hypothetical protein